MSTALATQSTFPTGADFDAMRNAAAIISRSGLVPEAFRGKPEDVMVAILTARGLGLDPMVALQKGYVIKGRFDIEVKVKLGLAMSRVPDFDHEVIEQTPERCTVRGGRAGKAPHEVTFTIDQAKRMNLTGKDPWRTGPEDMLYNRALGRLLNRTCAHALFNMPVVLDEIEPEDDVPPAPEPARPASSAEVVGAGPATPEPASTSEGAYQVAVEFTEGAAQPVPEDWLGRLLRGTAAHYKLTPPGSHKNAYAKWIKTNGAHLAKVVNFAYADAGQDPVKAWVSVPPMDYEMLAKWIEKRVGAAVEAAGGTDATPAQDDGAGTEGASGQTEPEGDGSMASSQPAPEEGQSAPEDDEVPAGGQESPPSPVSGWQLLVGKGHLHMVNVLMACRHATKGAREFIRKSAKTGNYELIDGDVLKACGFLNQHGSPQPQWLHKVRDGIVYDGAQYVGPNESAWLMVCRAVYDAASEMKVSVE